jgi:hypothetical protein
MSLINICVDNTQIKGVQHTKSLGVTSGPNREIRGPGANFYSGAPIFQRNVGEGRGGGG